MTSLLGVTNIYDLIAAIDRIPTWNDDPPFYKYSCQLNTSNFDGDGFAPDEFTSGTSLIRDVAYLKAACEALERYSLAYYKTETLIVGSHEQLLHEGKKPISPQLFCYLNSVQLKQRKFCNFSYSEKESFSWTECVNILTDNSVLIPAQLIYCPYKYQKEKTINLPISTGSALGNSEDEAVFKGICEVVERDAFITGYLLSIEPTELIFALPSAQLSRYLRVAEKYHIKITCYKLTSDIEIPTVLCIIWGDHFTTPAIAIGLKTEFDLEKAVIGAIEEAFQIRDWLRRCLLTNNFTGSNYTEQVCLLRAKFWSNPKNIHLIDAFALTTKKTTITRKLLTENSGMDYSEKLARAKKILKQKNLSSFAKNISHPLLERSKLKVSKVIIPELHPHFIDENYPYFGGKRLTALMKKYSSKINKVPHPFL